MLLFSSYSPYLLIVLTVMTGVVGTLFFGFRCYKFLAWYKSSKRNIMILAFAVQTALLAISVGSTVVFNTEIYLGKPATIDPQTEVVINSPTFLPPV